MATFDKREKERLEDDLQCLYDTADRMHRLCETGDDEGVSVMLTGHLAAIRDLAGRLGVEIVEGTVDDDSE